MNFYPNSLLATFVMLFATSNGFLAQGTTSILSEGNVSLTKLLQPIYPPLAKQARIAGDVVVEIQVRKDGSVESTQVISGHPLLRPAALDSAQHSQYECKDCGEGEHSYQIVYSFQLGPTRYCADSSETSKADDKQDFSPRVIESKNHVTVIDYPVGTCDSAITITKARSLKCLYLWRCSTR
jgi:TonB family protein